MTTYYKSLSFVVIFTLTSALGPISHWIYASQYLKTSLLIKELVERAFLLSKKHKAVIDKFDKQDQISQWKNFIQKHNQIDGAMQLEKARTKRVHKIFLFIDISFSLLILSIEGIVS